jgi:hypothetical protein
MKKISLFICVVFFAMHVHSQTLPQKDALTQNPVIEVNISSNPARNDFVVAVNSVEFTTAQISLYNMLGEQLSVRTVELEAGRNNFSYPGINLFPGNYFISVKTSDRSIVKKVIIE